MAITFEQKSNFGKNMLILVVLISALAGGVFYVWNALRRDNAQVDLTPPLLSHGIDTEIFQNPSLAELEIFPEIPLADPEPPRQNPFAKQSGIVDIDPMATGGASSD